MSQAFEILGTIGGSSIALSLVPQVIKTYRTKSARDISYTYQAIYIFGCTLVNLYAIGLGLWPIYTSCLIEESLIISLTVMKFVYDRRDNDELDCSRRSGQIAPINVEKGSNSNGEGVAMTVRMSDLEQGFANDEKGDAMQKE